MWSLPTTNSPPLAGFLLAQRSAALFLQVPLGKLDPIIARSFAGYQSHIQHEYAYHYRVPALIEPADGFVVTPHLQAIPESMPHYWEHGVPTRYALLRRWLGAPVQREHQVIVLREFGEANYYHFFNDVLGKLALFDELQVGKDWPLLISARLYAQPYFQGLLRCSALRERHWLVQHTAFVRADETLFCKPMPHMRRNFDYVLDRMTLPPLQGERRVLLIRQPARGRWLENQADVEAVCRTCGFETVDADALTFEAQIAVFRATRFVVGIHGAGLLNCMFRRGGPLDLLELFPPENIPPHYFWLAHNYNFGYDALVGSVGAQPGAFRIDPVALRKKLAAMLK